MRLALLPAVHLPTATPSSRLRSPGEEKTHGPHPSLNKNNGRTWDNVAEKWKRNKSNRLDSIKLTQKKKYIYILYTYQFKQICSINARFESKVSRSVGCILLYLPCHRSVGHLQLFICDHFRLLKVTFLWPGTNHAWLISGFKRTPNTNK